MMWETESTVTGQLSLSRQIGLGSKSQVNERLICNSIMESSCLIPTREVICKFLNRFGGGKTLKLFPDCFNFLSKYENGKEMPDM
jgi:hypothetical protein